MLSSFVDSVEEIAKKLDYIDRKILSFFYRSEKPLGSWNINELLENSGVTTSTATIGRKLKSFDTLGITLKVSNKGRVLSDKGKAVVRVLDEFAIRTKLRNKAVEATAIDTVDDVLDVVMSRRCIEAECARLAAENATEAELEKIRNTVYRHKECVMLGVDPTETAFDFHVAVAEASHSRLLLRLMKLIVFEEGQIESKLEYLVTRERGAEYVVEHETIAEAIANRNPEAASMLMQKHIDVLVKALEGQLSELKMKNKKINM